MKATQQRIQHLYLRAGFGIRLPQLQQFRNETQALGHLLRSSEQVQELALIEQPSFSLAEFMQMGEDEKKERAQKNRQGIRELNRTWLSRMAESDAQLREKMTLFWHGHFAVRHNIAARAAQQQINLLHQHALGNFRDLLHAISKDPAMLRFLNNQQNRKAHPNENFAREVLELFTLGRGNYTEQDIREAARAFTGWSALPNGTFIFRRRQHDYGVKTFMGKTGKFGGEDILNIILDNPLTARHITEKLYRYFVHTEVDSQQVEKWAHSFYASGYDLSQLLREIFSSEHFFNARNIGNHIKSPVEYLVGMMRMLDMKFDNAFTPLAIQKTLGQILLQPPNVAGWPEGKAWIDSSSLIMRLRIPQALIYQHELSLKSKEAFAGNEEGVRLQGREKRLRATIKWNHVLSYVEGLEPEAIIDRLAHYFLQNPLSYTDTQTLTGFIHGNTREEQIKSLVMRILCTPEYQMY